MEDKNIVKLTKIKYENFRNIERGTIILPNVNNESVVNHKSSILGLYGQNGSGKSTLIYSIKILKLLFSGEDINIQNIVSAGKENSTITYFLTLYEECKEKNNFDKIDIEYVVKFSDTSLWYEKLCYFLPNSDRKNVLYEYEIQKKQIKIFYEKDYGHVLQGTHKDLLKGYINPDSKIIKNNETAYTKKQIKINFDKILTNNINKKSLFFDFKMHRGLWPSPSTLFEAYDSEWCEDLLNSSKGSIQVYIMDALTIFGLHKIHVISSENHKEKVNALTTYSLNLEAQNKFFKLYLTDSKIFWISPLYSHKDDVFEICEKFNISQAKKYSPPNEYELRRNVSLSNHFREKSTLELKENAELHEKVYSLFRSAFKQLFNLTSAIFPSKKLCVDKSLKLLSIINEKPVPIDYESYGVKRIIQFAASIKLLFNTRQNLIAIDEFDSGIFERLLGTLIEIIEEKGQGQLIFTCHNLRPLEYLDNDSLCFTTTNSKSRFIKLPNKERLNMRGVYLDYIDEGYGKHEVFKKIDEFEIIKNLCNIKGIGNGKKK